MGPRHDYQYTLLFRFASPKAIATITPTSRRDGPIPEILELQPPFAARVTEPRHQFQLCVKFPGGGRKKKIAGCKKRRAKKRAAAE